MKRLNWWTTIVLLLISQAYAASVDAKTQESDLKADSSKELLKAAASSAEYSASLANDYANEKQQDNVAASSSSVSSAVESGNYNAADGQSQYSQPLSYSQPGTPVQPIHSYSQPLNYAPQALPYTSESQVNHAYNPAEQGQINAQVQSQQYPSLKDVPNPEIPAASASSSYYPQYPAHQPYSPHLVLQQQASAPVSDYHNGAQVEPAPQYESNQGQGYAQPQQQGYAQPQQQQVYLHQQHHVAIPGSSYSEQSYVVDGNKQDAGYAAQASSYSQPLPPEYSPEYSHGNGHSVNNVQVKPKKTVILAIPVKLVAKNKYGQGNNGGYQPQPEIQPHYSSNVVPAAANLPVAHSIEKNNYGNYGNDDKQSGFQEKPLYADKPAYTEKAVDDYQKVNHNLNNNLNNNGGYSGEYEPEADHYRGPRGPYQHKPSYNPGREVKPLSNYQTRPRKPTGYGPGPEYTTSNGPAIEEEIAIAPEHSSYPAELEHNHLHALPALHKHKINDVYEPIADHLPPPYIPSDFPSLGGPLTGISSYANPMELIYSSPYKLSGPPAGYGKPSGYRPSLLGSASSQSPTSTSSSSNYGQFLSSLLSAYSLGSLKPSSSKPSGSKGGLASYLNNLPGLDLLKGYSSLSPSYSSSLLTSASGMNKYYYMPGPKQPGAAPSKPGYPMGWPSELAQPQKPKPTGLLASSSNIVSSIDELFKSSLNPGSKFKRPLYSDATRAITNLYKKLLN